MAKADDKKTGDAERVALQEALAEAEERAKRATKRASQAEEDYRKLQLELVKAKDEAAAAQDKVRALEDRVTKLDADLAAMKTAPMQAKTPNPPQVRKTQEVPTMKAPTAPVPIHDKVEGMLRRVESLRELLAAASNELSQLHADEVALSKKRARVLSDSCTLLARALGVSGEAPPPLPPEPNSLGARLSLAPSVDISEVAELVESLRPPRL